LVLASLLLVEVVDLLLLALLEAQLFPPSSVVIR